MSQPDKLSDCSIEYLNTLLAKLKDKMLETLSKNACAHLDMGDENLYASEIEKLESAISSVELAITNKGTSCER